MVENVYIHIPFCRQKCYYCSFVSFVKSELKEKYVNVLINEIRTIYNNEQLKTLYFGGGTPSLLSTAEFNRIVNLFNITSDTEITAELNPENLSVRYLKEQVEEEENVGGVLAKLKLLCDDKKSILMLDKELAARTFTAPVIG